MYARAREQAEREKTLYRVYITDAARLLSESVAQVSGGKYLTGRWYDVIGTTPPPKEDNRSALEIASDIWRRIRGEKS